MTFTMVSDMVSWYLQTRLQGPKMRQLRDTMRKTPGTHSRHLHVERWNPFPFKQELGRQCLGRGWGSCIMTAIGMVSGCPAAHVAQRGDGEILQKTTLGDTVKSLFQGQVPLSDLWLGALSYHVNF